MQVIGPTETTINLYICWRDFHRGGGGRGETHNNKGKYFMCYSTVEIKIRKADLRMLTFLMREERFKSRPQRLDFELRQDETKLQIE